MPRVANRDLSETKAPTRHCEKRGCSSHTRERKPYCPKHVLEKGYAKDLAAVVEAAYDEVQKAAKLGKKAIDIDGLVIAEILCGLAETGEVTWRRLVKDRVTFLNKATTETTDLYLDKLMSAGFVTAQRNRRAYDVVALTPKGLKRVRRRA